MIENSLFKKMFKQAGELNNILWLKSLLMETWFFLIAYERGSEIRKNPKLFMK